MNNARVHPAAVSNCSVVRYAFILVALACSALFGHPGYAAAQTQAPATPVKISTGPYLQNPSDRAVTIMWITDRNTTGAVEYGTPDGELRTAVSSHDGLIDADERIHKVVLRNLEPGTVYRYRVISREVLSFSRRKVDFGDTVRSEFQEFRTFDSRKQDTSFLVFNDMHGNPSTFADLLKVAGGEYDFVFLNGDSVTYFDTESQITPMLDAAVSGFASRIPLFWSRGNHEMQGRSARQLPQYLDLPGGRYFHSFDQGPVHFIVLDSGEYKADSDPEYSGLVDFHGYRREQAEWLKAEVKTPAFQQARYRVVLVHIPFPRVGKLLAGIARTDDAVRTAAGMVDADDVFGKTLEEAGIDLMIAAHLHQAAIADPETGRHSYPIIQGGGSKSPGRTVIRVEANPRDMTVSVLREDGTTFGTRKVTARSVRKKLKLGRH